MVPEDVENSILTGNTLEKEDKNRKLLAHQQAEYLKQTSIKELSPEELRKIILMAYQGSNLVYQCDNS